MSFDVTSPADLLALKTEIQTDPVGMGYPANVNTVTDLLNDENGNLGLETGIPPLTARRLVKALAGEPLNAANQNWMLLLFEPSASFEDDLSEFRGEITALNDVGLNNNIGALTRPLSRAEVLFSAIDENGSNEFINLTVLDVETAMAS